MNLFELFEFLVSAELQSMVLAVIGVTKLLRNLLGNIKGSYAIAATILVSIVAGEVLFAKEMGFLFAGIGGLVAGLESALGFKLTKFFGKNVTKLDKQ